MLTPEQKALRRTGIGSSDIGTIIGVSPYSAIETWREKVEGYERPDNPDMERGRFLEPAVAAWYAHRMNCELEDPGTLVHPTNPLVIATPDRIAGALSADGRSLTDFWAVELKTCSRSDDVWGSPGTDEVPMHYLSQVQWELLVTGYKRADLAVLKWGRTLDIYNINADEELQTSLVQMATEWWDKYVRTATPPPVDGSKSYADWLKAKYPRNEKPMIAADANVEGMVATLREEAELAEKHEATAERFRQRIKEVIGPAEGIVGNGWSITWRATKTGSRVFKTKFQEAHQ